MEPSADHYFEFASTFVDGGAVPLRGAGVNLCAKAQTKVIEVAR